jgi:hypothetical protein
MGSHYDQGDQLCLRLLGHQHLKCALQYRGIVLVHRIAEEQNNASVRPVFILAEFLHAEVDVNRIANFDWALERQLWNPQESQFGIRSDDSGSEYGFFLAASEFV